MLTTPKLPICIQYNPTKPAEPSHAMQCVPNRATTCSCNPHSTIHQIIMTHYTALLEKIGLSSVSTPSYFVLNGGSKVSSKRVLAKRRCQPWSPIVPLA